MRTWMGIVSVMAIGCGGGGASDFDVGISLDGFGSSTLLHGNTAQIRGEAARAKGATGTGSDGPIAMLSLAITERIQNVQNVASADGRLTVIQRTSMIDLVSTTDGSVKTTVTVAGAASGVQAVLAIQDDGSHIAIMLGNGPFTMQVVDVATGTAVNGGAVTGVPRARFVGPTLYLQDASGLFRIGADGTRTKIAGVETASEIFAEPKGTRLWGTNVNASQAESVFYIEGGTADAIMPSDAIEKVGRVMAVGQGGRLVVRSGNKLYVTGEKGAGPSETKLGSPAVMTPMALSPDGSALLLSVFDQTSGGIISYESVDGETASVDTAGAGIGAIYAIY